MHVDEAESELLKTWTIKKLESISDADSDVLADYVLALAKTDEPEPVARSNCVENLRDFLLDGTDKFVNDLFLAIKTKSYDPARPPLKPEVAIYHPPKRASLENQSLPNGSRKRSYHDWDGEGQAPSNGRLQPYQDMDRPSKQPRRGGRGFEQRGGMQSHVQISQLPQMPTPPPGMPQLDPNNPMAALFAMQQAMGVFAGMSNGSGSPPNLNSFMPPRVGQRCRDYDTKGFCSAGASCPYEHGDDSFVIPGQEYDPNNATMLNVTPSRIGHLTMSQNTRGRGSPNGRARGANNWRGGGRRADFSYTGPNRDTSVTSIVVEQIPDDKCDEQTVHEFFSEFGDIENISLQLDKKLAIVKFSGYDAARAAYESPKVVFDNRFVKVYWCKPDTMSKLVSTPIKQEQVFDDRFEDVAMPQETHVDLEQFAKRQEEAQRKHEEAQTQRVEAAKRKLDLDVKLRAMEAERQKMASKLAEKSGKVAIIVEPPGQNGSMAKTQALQAQLARLEAEAKSLGIDPEEATRFSSPPTYRGRGAYRGRPRGRGYYSNYRGFGAGTRGGAVMRLDNRPKTVAVTFAEGSYEKHEEALRQFLLFNSLDSATVSKHPDGDDMALVAFLHRFEGESFMDNAAGSELLHMGKVNLAWYSPASTVTTSNGTHDRDSKMDVAEVKEQESSATRDATNHDVAEDEDLDRWG